MLWRALLFLVVLVVVYGEVKTTEINFHGEPIVRISSKKFDRLSIIKMLLQCYEKMFPAANGHAPMHLGSGGWVVNDERSCIQDTEVSYYVKSIALNSKEYEASECRINLNQRYKAIVSPSLNIHEYIHMKDDSVLAHVESTLIEKFATMPKLSEFKWYQLSDLNYKLQCLIDYQDIGQVKLKEDIVEVELERVFDIPHSCGFNRYQKNDQSSIRFTDTQTVQIPINGTFYCRNGRSSTCNRSKADFLYPHYKLFED